MSKQKPIIMLGDIHGDLQTLKYHLTSKKITDCHLIQVGDFGVGYHKLDVDKKNLKELNKFLKEKNIQMYVIRGNHDDPKFYDGSHMYSNLFLLSDYTTAVIEGKRFLFVGGAISIDRKPSKIRFLTKGIKSHWEDEVFVYDEEKNKMFIPGAVDILVTHTCGTNMMGAMNNARILNPSIVQSFALKYNDETLIEELEIENIKVQQLVDSLPNLEQHFFGHFHSSFKHIENKTTYKLLDIFEFYEFRTTTISSN